MKKYSQYDEQQYILGAFEGRPPGRFLDIGAYHPFEFSNTRALYELGWSGVMVEPSPGPMSSLIREYGNDPRITLIQALVVTVFSGSLHQLFVTDDCVSTIVPLEFERWRKTASFNGKILIPSVPLSAIIQLFARFDFINFDAEGLSVDLFVDALSFDFLPHCVCCENDGAASFIRDRAAIEGYSRVYTNETNSVFVRNES